MLLQEMMLSKDTRRKLSVHVTGAKVKSQQQEAGVAEPDIGSDGCAAANGASGKEDNTVNGDVHSVVADHKVQLITDIWAFKRSQMLYPSVR